MANTENPENINPNIIDLDFSVSESDNILQNLRDFAYIINESKGSAVVTMLEGFIFDEAADEIEQLTQERNHWQSSAAGLSQDISNAEDEIELLKSMGDMMVNSINYLLGDSIPSEDLSELLHAWKSYHND
jgi:hypothetical protein